MTVRRPLAIDFPFQRRQVHPVGRFDGPIQDLAAAIQHRQIGMRQPHARGAQSQQRVLVDVAASQLCPVGHQDHGRRAMLVGVGDLPPHQGVTRFAAVGRLGPRRLVTQHDYGLAGHVHAGVVVVAHCFVGNPIADKRQRQIEMGRIAHRQRSEVRAEDQLARRRARWPSAAGPISAKRLTGPSSAPVVTVNFWNGVAVADVGLQTQVAKPLGNEIGRQFNPWAPQSASCQLVGRKVAVVVGQPLLHGRFLG